MCYIDPLSHVQVGYTALMRAANNGYTAIVQYLVERTTAQVNATDYVSHSNSVQCITVHVHWVLVNKYMLDIEAMGSTWYRNLRGSHIEPERVARGFSGNSRVSIPRRSHWPRRLTYLEYSHE